MLQSNFKQSIFHTKQYCEHFFDLMKVDGSINKFLSEN